MTRNGGSSRATSYSTLWTLSAARSAVGQRRQRVLAGGDHDQVVRVDALEARRGLERRRAVGRAPGDVGDRERLALVERVGEAARDHHPAAQPPVLGDRDERHAPDGAGVELRGVDGARGGRHAAGAGDPGASGRRHRPLPHPRRTACRPRTRRRRPRACGASETRTARDQSSSALPELSRIVSTTRRVGERRGVAQRPALRDVAQQPAHDLAASASWAGPATNSRNLGRAIGPMTYATCSRSSDGERVARLLAGLEDDEREDRLAADRVVLADDRRLGDGLVVDQRRLDLGGRDPVARRRSSRRRRGPSSHR